MDEREFLETYEAGSQAISNALICQVYCSALIYWDQSAVIKQHPRPELRYAWNQAVTAMEEEFLSPSLSTVHATLVSLIGRPIGTILGNTMGFGRVLALAHGLGLNRNPSNWKVSASERNTRNRLWWGLLIQDRWYEL